MFAEAVREKMVYLRRAPVAELAMPRFMVEKKYELDVQQAPDAQTFWSMLSVAALQEAGFRRDDIRSDLG